MSNKDSKPKVSVGVKKGGGIPPGFEKLRPADVYAKPSSNDKPIKRDPSKLQGVWTESFNTVNPVGLWIFDKGDEPPSLAASGHPYGTWGYMAGTDPKKCAVEEMMFIPPNAKPPKVFIPKGVWSFPVMKRDESSLKEKEAGFVHVGDATKKEDLDVAGQWRMLYHRPGEDKPPPPPKDMKIYVKKPNGEKITLKVKPENTIDDVKDMVKDRAGIPKDEQRLRHKGNPIDDKPTLKDYGVEDGDILNLDPMEIYVKDPKGKKYTLIVDPTDTIDQVKSKLENQEGIPKTKQRLTFNTRPCVDNKTLRSHGIKHQSVLHLEPMTIYVQDPKGKKYTLEKVDPSDTIDQIKSKLENQEGIPKKKQRLTFNNRPCIDNKNLDDHGIKHQSVLHLEPMTIYVQDSKGKKYTLENVDPSNTIDQIKSKLENQEGIPKKKQRLTFNNNPCIDNRKLDDHGIKHKSVLCLEPMEIYVRTTQGKKLTFDVESTDTIGDIKKRVMQKENIPMDQQRMSFGSKQLINDKATLDNEGIKHKDTIDLGPMIIYVKDWKGKTISFEVDPKEAIEDIKVMIEKRERHPVEEQILKFRAQKLEDRKNLEDYGIEHKDTLDLSKELPPAPPTPPQQTFTIQLSPYKSPLEAGYSPSKGKKRDGIRAKSKELLKNRWHTDLASETAELGRMAAEKHRKERETKA